MQRPSEILRYHEEDRTLRCVEDLSRHGRISCAFIRLCLGLGCPIFEDRLSLAILLDWLMEHHRTVRVAAGLPQCAELGDLPEAVAAKINVGNAMLTLLEYSESRATDLRSKQHLGVMIRCVERTLDR